ncbi:MAG: redox-sensitive transcriptional activator SoxR [Actinobacteria bacterium]|nr:redox-sensitive transcriptional activator SoxR [Actinomycetota bacterium]MCA1722130.1 redox-sensitive transcriptional activator SoxR [Actinomycetota bacterium]
MPDVLLSIGEIAWRAGVTVATLRYYEQRGLISSVRTAGNQRRYSRHVLRRLAFIAAAQRVQLPLQEIATMLGTLPEGRAPTRADWTRLARPWRAHVQGQIDALQALQNTLDGCLGCGCLSLTRCRLYNPGDEASAEGAGSRWLREADGTSGSPP